MPAQRNYLTIVSGLPRSGTSLMMQMIDAGGIVALTDHIRTADEDNPKGYYEFEPVKKTRKDASWLEGAPGKVVKMVHLLLMDLPLNREYRVVFMRRKLDEVVKSQDIMLERSGKQSGNLTQAQIVKAFETQLAQVEKWMKDHEAAFKYLYVSYNDVMANPQPQVAEINEFLGGDLNTDAMLAVVDPSLYRNRL